MVRVGKAHPICWKCFNNESCPLYIYLAIDIDIENVLLYLLVNALFSIFVDCRKTTIFTSNHLKVIVYLYPWLAIGCFFPPHSITHTEAGELVIITRSSMNNNYYSYSGFLWVGKSVRMLSMKTWSHLHLHLFIVSLHNLHCFTYSLSVLLQTTATDFIQIIGWTYFGLDVSSHELNFSLTGWCWLVSWMCVEAW